MAIATTKQFLHLAVSFENPSTGPSVKAVEEVLNQASDWIRYAPNCWLIYTTNKPSIWHDRLFALPGMKNQTYFICQVDVTARSGFLRKATWDWIQKDRS